MHLLALPEDEQQIIRHLCEQEGLQLLLSNLLAEGSPRVAADPLRALLPELPSSKQMLAAVKAGAAPSDPARQQVWEYLLWAPSLGPIRTLADAPAPRDAVDRVALQLNREATQQWRDLIDLARTPVLSLRRTGWHSREECLIAGAVTTLCVRVRDLPREVVSLHSRVERYLKRHSQRLDPFETCQLYTGPRLDPRQTRGWWMWAMPQAQAWLAAGGQAFVIDFL